MTSAAVAESIRCWPSDPNVVGSSPNGAQVFPLDFFFIILLKENHDKIAKYFIIFCNDINKPI